MPALTDAEILAALPVEARQKIDTAFEALSQSLPSDKERIILYRVASTLKLNPTDTHFSVMAAMHYYLQLYQEIPSKIEKASAERLKEFSSSLKNTAAHEMEMARDSVISELSKKVGGIAQNIAGDAAAAERDKAFWRAAVGVLACSIIFGGTGYVLRMSAEKLMLVNAAEQIQAANSRADAAVETATKRAEAEIADFRKMAVNEFAAVRKSAGWAGTEEGLLAKQFFDSGAGLIAVKCSSKKWEIINRPKEPGSEKIQKWCVPKSRPLFGWDDEEEHGWKIP